MSRLNFALPAILAMSIITPATAHYVDAGEYSANKGPKKSHTNTSQSRTTDPWDLLVKALTPSAMALTGNVSITVSGAYRYVRSNGIPDHATGNFPNAGNPNTMSEQNYVFRMPLAGAYAAETTPLGMSPFGVAVNGVPFDPGANEFWNRDRNSGWQYEAMALGPRLGMDQNNAHVQPNGAYHYHGIPTGLLDKLKQANRPVLIGYAADGFPIYGPYGYRNALDPKSGLAKLKSSYRIKSGNRDNSGNSQVRTGGGGNGPGGKYDGTFVQDYEYVAKLGDLDDCNGRYGYTPEYPKGTYYYVVTDNYPYIPRAYKGTPDETFRRHPPQGGRRGPGGGPPGGGGFGGGPPGGGGFGGGPPGGGPPGGGPPGGGPPGGGPPGGGGFGGGGFGGGGFGGGPPGGGPPGGGPPGGGPPGGGPPGGGPPDGFGRGPNGGPPEGGGPQN